MRIAAVEAFLTHLAVEGRVAASTQNQALSALLFHYREVLAINLPWLDGVARAKQPQRLPVVFTRQEVGALLDRMSGLHGLMARLLFGTGMRLTECVRLRVKDVDFERAEIVVRDGKGAKDRVTMLPQSLIPPLQDHLRWRRQLYLDDLTCEWAAVYMPDALDENIRMRPVSGPGRMSFKPWTIRSIRVVARSAVIISTRSRCSGR
jgi:integrase